jgi:hypothetical protein
MLHRLRRSSNTRISKRTSCRRESLMGADAFVAFYSVRYILADDEVEAVETNRDRRVVAARGTKLQLHMGRLTDGEPYFLLIGLRLGVFGVENDSYRSFDALSLERIMVDTRGKLAEAGLSGEPQLHLQLEAQY